MKKYKLYRQNNIVDKLKNINLKCLLSNWGVRIGAGVLGVIIVATILIPRKNKKKEEIPDLPKIITVKVVEGDTLSELAEFYYTTIDEIVKLNDIENSNLIEVGQKLKIKPGEEYFNQENPIVELWNKKIRENGYVKGIDISKYQYYNNLNLEAVIKQNDIDFVIIKSNYFWENREYEEGFDEFVEIAHKNDIAIGIYFWPTLKNIETTKEELDVVCNKLDELKDKGIYCTMPIFLDIERRTDGGGDLAERIKNGDEETEKCFKFAIEYLRQKGYDIRVYANSDCCKNYGVEALASKYNVGIWLAKYQTNNEINQESEPPERYLEIPCDIIQYSQMGCVEGYSYNIDLDVCYKNIPKEIIENGLNGTNDLKETKKSKS